MQYELCRTATIRDHGDDAAGQHQHLMFGCHVCVQSGAYDGRYVHVYVCMGMYMYMYIRMKTTLVVSYYTCTCTCISM